MALIMINYDKNDHYNYLAERSFYICSLIGIEPCFVDETNYEMIRQGLVLSLSGGDNIKVLNELRSILIFSVVTKEETA